MRKLDLVARLCLGLVGFAWAAAAHAQVTSTDRPRIRAVTAYVNVTRVDYAARMDETAAFLAAARPPSTMLASPAPTGASRPSRSRNTPGA